MDACPGRLNQVQLYIKKEGIYYGQCSELCGINHGFMPIVVHACNMDFFFLSCVIKNFPIIEKLINNDENNLNNISITNLPYYNTKFKDFYYPYFQFFKKKLG
jgi:hypothetical protein